VIQIHHGFYDGSGGSVDSAALAIAHADISKFVLDGCWERKAPHSPASAIEEFSTILRQYGVKKIIGDKYAAGFPVDMFRQNGIGYEPSTKSRSELYLEFLGLLNSGRVELPKHARLLAQLRGLERRVAKGGREYVDHVAGSHDDLANAACGAICLCAARAARPKRVPFVEFVACPGIGSVPRASHTTGFPQDGKSSWWKEIS
jgi:hypothetical protein